MARLFGFDLKYVAAGGALGSAMPLTKEGCAVKVSPHIIDEIGSESPEPRERYDIGAGIEIKAVLIGNSVAEFKAQLNITGGSTVINASRVLTLPKYDAQFKVKKPDDTDETWDITNVHFDGSLDAAFKGGESWYLPMVMKSTATTVLTIT